MSKVAYTDNQIEEFIEMAKDIGIGRSMRELGYPGSWATANRWITARGLTIDVDDLKQRSAAFNQWYKDEEVILVAQAGMERVHEQLVEKDLDADSIKKLAEGYQKFANTWLTVKGKVTSISESRTVGETDMEIKKMIAEMEELDKQQASADNKESIAV